MRIDPTSNFTPAAASTSSGTVGQAGTIKTANRDGEVAAGNATNGFSPTADLARLLSAVKSLPDVRTDVVQDVSARVATGEVFTQSAASETASALLESKEI